MPYIKEVERERFDDVLEAIDNKFLTGVTPGILNYLLTSISLSYLAHKNEKYQTYNDIIGALECSKLEIYRKKISKYEDSKELENGTIW